MSIAEAAVAAGCSSAAIIQYELGNRVPRLSIIAPLLRVYRVSLEQLLFGTSKDVAA